MIGFLFVGFLMFAVWASAKSQAEKAKSTVWVNMPDGRLVKLERYRR
jgi:hypothetical protein